MKYIKVPGVFNKLKKAEEFYDHVIMMAPNSAGKSAAVEYYYRRKKTLTLYCREGVITQMPDIRSIRTNVVVIEDMQQLYEEESVEYLRSLLAANGLQVVMLTRGYVPKYLSAENLKYDFVQIYEADFVLHEKEVEEYFKEREVKVYPEDIPLITKASSGYVAALHFYANHMENGVRYSDSIQEAVWQDIFQLWDRYVYEELTQEFNDFALAVCAYEQFSMDMAEYLTGNVQIGHILEYCRERTSQLNYYIDGLYGLRAESRKYFRWKKEIIWSREEITENYRRGANFYEIKGDIPNALRFYRKAEATQRIKELLIRNAYQQRGIAHYVDTKDSYFDLPEKELLSHPALIAGMSILYDLLFRSEDSEEWYGHLAAYEAQKSNPKEKRREAGGWLAWLDLVLPHRGIKKISGVMKEILAQTGERGVRLPDYSVTADLPSVINGAQDFFEWVHDDATTIEKNTKSVEKILGNHGRGFTSVFLAEKGFEQGMLDSYEVEKRLAKGYEAADHGGGQEICFASVGILLRQHVAEGRLPDAVRLCRTFKEKMEEEKGERFLPNVEALEAWLSLFGGGGNNARQYVKKIPSPLVEFNFPYCYRQMTRLRCLIALDRLGEALEVSNYLSECFSQYDRHFRSIENELLKAVILYRMENAHWCEHFSNALHRASDYGLVRVITLEGEAVLSLLEKMVMAEELQDIPQEYMTRLQDECRKISLFYPDYLKTIPRESITFTKREETVLYMLCAGKSTAEICEELKITYDGLKKHNRNIYKKLGVKNRIEAERKAVRMGLVHRGSQ